MDKLKILIVDDSEFFRSQLRGTLSTFGIKNIDDVSSPESALLAIQQTTYDLALIDLVMPRMNGVELIKKIESNDLNIIAMSTLDNEEIKVKAIEGGAQDFLQKPVQIEELRESILSIFRGII